MQSVTAEDRPNVGLTVVFYKAIGEDKKLLRVVVPLGVLLPTGLGLKIDNQDVGNAPFLKCGKRGCVAEVVLQNEVIDKLKKGTNAMFIIFDIARSRHRHTGQLAGLRRRAGRVEISVPIRAKKSAAEKEKSAAETSVFGGRTSVHSVQGSGKDGYFRWNMVSAPHVSSGP